ncbi:hypothetical protein VOLCADRAFT_75328, partial [Volvox carteri f. nagariensis]
MMQAWTTRGPCPSAQSCRKSFMHTGSRICANYKLQLIGNSHAHLLDACPHLPRFRRIQLNGTPEVNRGAMTAEASGSDDRKVGVLFVCLGNICRSPTAEAVFRSAVERVGLAAAFDIDSCGTGGGSPDWFTEGGWSYHEGDAADSRMAVTARKRGVLITSRSRPLQPVDLTRFDYIIGMDAKNLRAIRAAADYWLVRPMGQGKVPQDYSRRISLMTSYC